MAHLAQAKLLVRYLVDPASSHMLVPKIKPCMSKYKPIYTVKLRMAHYISYNLFDDLFTTWITVVILELIHAKKPRLLEGGHLLDTEPMGATSLLVNHNN